MFMTVARRGLRNYEGPRCRITNSSRRRQAAEVFYRAAHYASCIPVLAAVRLLKQLATCSLLPLAPFLGGKRLLGALDTRNASLTCGLDYVVCGFDAAPLLI